MKNFLDKAGRLLAYIENAVIVTGFLIMFFVLLAQVIMRYVFNSPLTWSEETARFIFVYVSFVGISIAYRQKAHIRMEAVVKLLPPGIQTFLEAGIQAGTVALFLYMIPFSFKFIGIQAKVRSTATHIPMSIIYSALPLGMFIASLRMIVDLLGSVLAGKEEKG